jgi:hypothetical protein
MEQIKFMLCPKCTECHEVKITDNGVKRSVATPCAPRMQGGTNL